MLASAMGIEKSYLFFPSQVHKTRIASVTRHTHSSELMETDALIANERGVCIAVMSADCVPILLFDRQNNAIGAVHSGWRGTVAKILSLTLQEMQRHFGTKPDHLCAAIGPSVSQDAYEVGGEVIESVRNVFSDENDLLSFQTNGKAKLDLWKNVQQLQEFGVARRVSRFPVCVP
jgi:YfiH family protein